MSRPCARCDWAPPTDPSDDAPTTLAEHAADAAHPLCIIDRHRSLTRYEQQTCEQCLTRVREHLAEIVELYALLPGMLARLPNAADWRRNGPRSDERPLPGGNALPMLAGGSQGRSQVRGVLLPGGARSTDHEADELPQDPLSVAYELSRWEDDWRITRREEAATYPATVVTAAGYLERKMRWAATSHPAFDEFARDLRRLRARLRAVTGRGERPETGAPCFDCGTLLERTWTDAGLTDHYSCPVCRRAYTPAAYVLAMRAKLEEAQ